MELLSNDSSSSMDVDAPAVPPVRLAIDPHTTDPQSSARAQRRLCHAVWSV